MIWIFMATGFGVCESHLRHCEVSGGSGGQSQSRKHLERGRERHGCRPEVVRPAFGCACCDAGGWALGYKCTRKSLVVVGLCRQVMESPKKYNYINSLFWRGGVTSPVECLIRSPPRGGKILWIYLGRNKMRCCRCARYLCLPESVLLFVRYTYVR